MQASVTDYFKAKKRGREPDNLSGKSSKLMAVSLSSAKDVPVPIRPIKDKLVNETEEAIVTKIEKLDDGSKRTIARRKKPEKVSLVEEKGASSTSHDLAVELEKESIESSSVKSSPCSYVHKGMLSPKKKVQLESSKPRNVVDFKKLLKNKSKLADLKAALEGINGCAEKLAEFRRNAAKGNSKTTQQDSTESPKVAVEAEKFYSPRKITDIFSSPTKVHQIGSPLKVSQLQIKKRLFDPVATEAVNQIPAYQRFHNLAEKSEVNLPLPYKFKVLDELFNAVETVTSILHNRKELITFIKVRAGVLELIRRAPLKQSHFGQILTVLPGCYTLSQEKVKVHGVSSYQLVVTVQSDESMSATLMTSRRKTFKQNLLNICHQHHKEFLETLEPPIVVPADRSVTRWHPRFKLDNVPDIIGQPIAPAPETDKRSSAKDVINRAQNILDNANPRMKKAVQDMLNRKMIEESEKLAPKTNKISEKNKKTLTALKGISQSLIEKIRAREQEKSIRSLTLTPEESKRKSMMSRLPEFVKIIRNTFVAEKKTALPIGIAIERIGHSGYGSMPAGEVEDHLRLLCSVLPEWMKLLSLSQGEYVKIEKQLDINELIIKLENVVRKTV